MARISSGDRDGPAALRCGVGVLDVGSNPVGGAPRRPSARFARGIRLGRPPVRWPAAPGPGGTGDLAGPAPGGAGDQAGPGPGAGGSDQAGLGPEAGGDQAGPAPGGAGGAGGAVMPASVRAAGGGPAGGAAVGGGGAGGPVGVKAADREGRGPRSEERRVGKEGRSRWSPY